MNLGSLLLGFVMMVLIAGMIVFVAASQPISVVDSGGATYSAAANTTNGLVTNVTAVGGTSTGALVVVLMALGLIAGVGLLAVLAKR